MSFIVDFSVSDKHENDAWNMALDGENTSISMSLALICAIQNAVGYMRLSVYLGIMIDYKSRFLKKTDEFTRLNRSVKEPKN